MDYKKLNDLAKEPTRGSDAAAGWDLYAATSEKTTIPPHQAVMIGTGIAVKIPDDNFGAIFARSGLASKQGLRPSNCVGVIDSDYRGELLVSMRNDTGDYQEVEPGDRIAQLVIIPYTHVEWREVKKLDETKRGNGGFGSTGKK